MLYSWIDIFPVFMVQQTIGIPMSANYFTLFPYLFLHVFEADFVQELLINKDSKLTHTLDYNFHYVCSVTEQFLIR